MAFQSNQVTWQPPEGLSNSRPRLVRLSGPWHRSGMPRRDFRGLRVNDRADYVPCDPGKIEHYRLLQQQGVAAAGTVSRVWK